MNTRIVKLLEKHIELETERNEMLREQLQLLGEVLMSLDKIGNTSNQQPMTQMPPIVSVTAKKTEPAPLPDQKLLDLMMHGTENVNEWEFGTSYDVTHFWPTGKANPGWVRVSIKHPSEDSLKARVAKGCLCGRPIVVKEHNGESFYSCEALTQKGSCPYRPAAYFDKLTFLMNLPPTK